MYNCGTKMNFVPCISPFSLQDMCKMATEAISLGQTSVQAELRRTANTRKYINFAFQEKTFIVNIIQELLSQVL